MAGSHVNADVKTGRRREITELAHGFKNDVAGEGGNQVVLLGQGNKHVGRNPALTRVIPAQQDLNAHALLRSGIDQRLAEQLEFTRRQPHIDLPGKAHPAGGGKPGDVPTSRLNINANGSWVGRFFNAMTPGPGPLTVMLKG
ncbi:Uncharacterised protein [Enterobacter cancerogenus]|uniref:Uncharacterized protein n=1 Tax=Enterobacter cancerogenus TaxID=69218 RepID=A0A484W6J9_9ENTR|nr:Uncharacterised protein [Enterobacter cancerogenus]